MIVGLACGRQTVQETTHRLCSRHQNTPVDGGAYYVENNHWTGTTCIETDGGNDFTVSTASISSANGPGAFHEIWSGCHWGSCTSDDDRGGRLPIRVGDLGDTTSSWTTTLPMSGTYDAAYDLWFNTTSRTTGQPNGGEVMIWLGERGVSDRSSTVWPVDGADWYVARGTQRANGATWPLVVYQRVTPTTSVSKLDLRYFVRDAVIRGIVSLSSYLISVEAGYEIWQADGAPGLTTSSFSVSPARGIPTGRITSALSASKCVEDWQGDTGAGNRVRIHDCDGTGAQSWAVSMNGGIQVTIHGTTMCMGLSDSKTSKGTEVVLENCDGSATEIWEPGAVGALWNEASGLCLAAPGSSTANGTPLIIWTCDGGSEQDWRLPAIVR
jgi:hypothetical protein